MKRQDQLSVRNASENNLRSVSLDIPKNKLVVVTGVSGSGKSSLVFDVIYREAQRRYLSTFTTYARQFLQKTRVPNVESITGLSPAIAIDQHSISRNTRSTVGTLTEIYDYLRLLYARVGIPDTGSKENKPPSANRTPSSGIRHRASGINRSLFSFNSPEGACPACKGLGVEDRLDPELMIRDPRKSIREGCMVITAPNGYIIYSQVTLDVLNEVCQAEGFSIDIPWQEMTPAQHHVILYGSEKLEVPYGKHPLESRMKWSGITAKPREMGYYKGIIPVMETILKRERNKNILRFVRTTTCSQCQGTRLNPRALSVTVWGQSIADLAGLQIDELGEVLRTMEFTGPESMIARPVIEKILDRIAILEELGLGYLTASRESTTLSAGEAQRIRLAVQIGMELRGLLYILDEPSVGLHPNDSMRIIRALQRLRDKGNSVLVVEHEEAFIRHADWLIDLGPGAGTNGGEVLVNCAVSDLSQLPQETIDKSLTLQYLFSPQSPHHLITSSPHHLITSSPHHPITILGASLHNLQHIDVEFKARALNVVTGVSGAGKSSLVNGIIGQRIPGSYREMRGWEEIDKVITIDQSPIGKSSRSNPATYTGLFDHIRDLFASLPESKERGYSKSRFSFNTVGGRCEACQGAGYHQTGMHFLGVVEVECSVCQGRQFDEETLGVRYEGKTIAEVLDLAISEAIAFFSKEPAILKYLEVMEALGLGYLHLGQRSSTLSGGEAQRIKLATELARPAAAHTLYLLDEPTTGLHQADVAKLMEALQNLVRHRHTVIVTEHHQAVIQAADHMVELGPGSGKQGGRIVYMGSPHRAVGNGQWAAGDGQPAVINPPHHLITPSPHHLITPSPHHPITFSNVTTNNLKGISFAIPSNKITVITGISGSGKSSLAFDTLYTEGRNRFLESFSSYARAQLGVKDKPDFEEVSGLTPTFAVNQQGPGSSPRSTVGTYTGIYDSLRLLFARFGIPDAGYLMPDEVNRHLESGIRHPFLSSQFSFNDIRGACPRCEGLGSIRVCSPLRLVTHPGRALVSGAMDGTKTGKFYGEEFGQYVSILKAVGERHRVDYSKPWSALTAGERQLALEGTGEEEYDVTWQFKRGERSGEHRFSGKWTGFLALVNQEYARKHAGHRGDEMKAVMEDKVCPECNGTRLNREALSYRIAGKTIAELAALPVRRLDEMIRILPGQILEQERGALTLLANEILNRTGMLTGMGLGYIPVNRPTDTLSGGEFQRIRLSGQMGSGLTGITYVLDEPTAGLHPSDTEKLFEKIELLKESGNTVVMVEHDPEVISHADFVIDLGPGAGSSGGEIVAKGTPAELRSDPNSVTGPFLKRNRLKITSGIRHPASGISIVDATLHNLDHVSVDIPAGVLVAITGPSGSGKSTLMNHVILGSAEAKQAHGCRAISGLNQFERVVDIRQKRQFAESRGCVATYSGILDQIRDLYAKSPRAKELALNKSHFSFLSPQGGCQECGGSGEIRISMDFMADVTVVCERCQGNRYQEKVLQISVDGSKISEILAMTLHEAGEFFRKSSETPGAGLRIATMLQPLTDIGLGYLTLGQSLDTLSGGEAQRLALARELIHPVKGKALFLFNEPSSGLHPADLPSLLALFDQLINLGHSIILIEHNAEIILHADWIIDLGPGGGEQGGKIVVAGTPQDILKSTTSLTGRFLSRLIKPEWQSGNREGNQ